MKKCSLSTVIHLHCWLAGSPNTLARSKFITPVALLGVSFQEVLSQINIQGFGVLASTLPLWVRILLGRGSWSRHYSHYQLTDWLPSSYVMNVQISWQWGQLLQREERCFSLGLLMVVLGYLSRYGCGHVLQAAGNLSWALGRQKSPVLLRWRMACLTKVSLSKPTTEAGSP